MRKKECAKYNDYEIADVYEGTGKLGKFAEGWAQFC